jgi:hypothetical protein
MANLACAAQINDLEKLRHFIDEEKASHPEISHSSLNKSTKAMQDACHAAARNNHPAALDLLLDSGCWIDPGKLPKSSIFRYGLKIFLNHSYCNISIAREK